MKMDVSASKYLTLYFLSLIPFFSLSQQTVDLKIKGVRQAKDSILISKYLQNIESGSSILRITTANESPIKLNFKIPRVKIYNAADYYVDGKFTYHPSSSWGPYQIPFHLNQPIVVPSKGN